MGEEVKGMSQEQADALGKALEKKAMAEATAALLRAKGEYRKNMAEAKQREWDAERVKIQLDAESDVEKERLLRDKYFHTYYFSGKVEEKSVIACMSMLDLWHRQDPHCEMTIIINASPGGEVMSGMALFDHILWLRRQGHRIVLRALGMAASMAGILLQAGDVREMGAEAYLLIHEVRAGVVGKVGEIEDELKLMQMMCDRVVSIFVKRSAEAKEAGTAEVAVTKAFMKKGWARTDWWISSDDCLKYGFVDRIV